MNKSIEMYNNEIQLQPPEFHVENIDSAELVLHDLFDQIHDGIVIVQGHYIRYANPQIARMLDFTADELRGKSVIFDLSPPEEQIHHRERVRRRASGQPMSPRFETKVIRSDGAIIAVEISTSPMTYDNQPAVLSVVRNITGRQQAQLALTSALSETEKYAHSLGLLNQMSQALNEARSEDAVFEVVGEWAAEIIRADRVCIALLPAISDETNGRELTVQALDGIIGSIPTGTKLYAAETAVGQPIKTRRTVYSADNRTSDYPDIQALHQSGLLSTVSAPLITSGRVLGTLNICSTRINAFDEKDQGLVKQMAALIATVLENRRLYEDAKRASEAKSLFLSNMTHELRTPMNAVLGMTSVLLDTELTDEQWESIDTIRTSGSQLLSIINDVLDFSKIEANKLELEMAAFNLKDTIEEALSLSRVTAAAKDLALLYHIEKDVPKWLIQDITRLRQILNNLVTNAIKFTHQGKVELNVSAQLIQGCQFQIQMAITDTGIGIPPHRIEKLFQSFSQVDPSTTRKYGGSGLGLSISKQLCELMGGEMWVESEVGTGSTFTFTFIAERTECQRNKIEKRVRDQRQGLSVSFDAAMGKKLPLKILLAEDNAVNQKVALSILGRFGYKADVAANGIEVLAALTRQHYDVVLMDIHMPEMDGVEATKRIRSQIPVHDQPSIIAVTANAMEQHREEYLAVGMDDYISKPISIMELVAALESVPARLALAAMM